MNDVCRFEREVLEAAESDRWTDALREHAAGCADCAAAAAVAPWMDRFAHLSDREHILPHPSIVWLKAQVMRNSAEMARASRPMHIVQMAAYLAVAAGWAVMLTWKWDDVQRLIDNFSATGFAAGSSHLLSLPLFTALLFLGTVTVTLAMHTILAED